MSDTPSGFISNCSTCNMSKFIKMAFAEILKYISIRTDVNVIKVDLLMGKGIFASLVKIKLWMTTLRQILLYNL